jgi:hypothetical protein
MPGKAINLKRLAKAFCTLIWARTGQLVVFVRSFAALLVNLQTNLLETNRSV